MNWAYVFLLDMILVGKVVTHKDKTVAFINHDYTAKSYHDPSAPKRTVLFKYFLRRANVHLLYMIKIAQKESAIIALLMLPVSLAALTREYSSIVLSYLSKYLFVSFDKKR